MKIRILSLFLLLFFFFAKAQDFELTTVISQTGILKYYELKTGKINFKIDEQGNLLSFSPDQFEGNYEYYYDYSSVRISGKIKQIGNLTVEYFDNFNEDQTGKPSKIGNVTLDYYKHQFSFKDGKLRKVGDVLIQYYDNEFTDDKKYGRLKSFNSIKMQYGGEMFSTATIYQLTFVGNTKILYWEDTFGTSQRGKIKSITGKTPKLKINVE